MPLTQYIESAILNHLINTQSWVPPLKGIWLGLFVTNPTSNSTPGVEPPYGIYGRSNIISFGAASNGVISNTNVVNVPGFVGTYRGYVDNSHVAHDTTTLTSGTTALGVAIRLSNNAGQPNLGGFGDFSLNSGGNAYVLIDTEYFQFNGYGTNFPLSGSPAFINAVIGTGTSSGGTLTRAALSSALGTHTVGATATGCFGASTTVIGIGLFDASGGNPPNSPLTAGNLLFYQALPSPITFNAGDSLSVPIGGLNINLVQSGAFTYAGANKILNHLTSSYNPLPGAQADPPGAGVITYNPIWVPPASLYAGIFNGSPGLSGTSAQELNTSAGYTRSGAVQWNLASSPRRFNLVNNPRFINTDSDPNSANYLARTNPWVGTGDLTGNNVSNANLQVEAVGSVSSLVALPAQDVGITGRPLRFLLNPVSATTSTWSTKFNAIQGTAYSLQWAMRINSSPGLGLTGGVNVVVKINWYDLVGNPQGSSSSLTFNSSTTVNTSNLGTQILNQLAPTITTIGSPCTGEVMITVNKGSGGNLDISWDALQVEATAAFPLLPNPNGYFDGDTNGYQYPFGHHGYALDGTGISFNLPIDSPTSSVANQNTLTVPQYVGQPTTFTGVGGQAGYVALLDNPTPGQGYSNMYLYQQLAVPQTVNIGDVISLSAGQLQVILS